MTCPHQGKLQVPWVSPPESLPAPQHACSMREYLFIARQPVPAINRRLEIPPDVIPGEKTAIPSPSPAPSHPARTALGRVVPRPQPCDLPTLCAVCSSRGAGGYEGEGSWGGFPLQRSLWELAEGFSEGVWPLERSGGGTVRGDRQPSGGVRRERAGFNGHHSNPPCSQPAPVPGVPRGFQAVTPPGEPQAPRGRTGSPAAPSPGQCQAAAGCTRTPVCGSRVGGQRGPPLTACVCREPQAAVGAAWPWVLSCCQPSCLRRSCVLLGTAAPPSTG